MGISQQQRQPHVPWSLLRQDISIVYEISHNSEDLLLLLLDEGLTNNQVAKELNFRRYRNPKTGRRWTPIAVKFAGIHARNVADNAKLLDNQVVC